MSSTINVAILEDHQSIVDGYLYRLGGEPGIKVVATASLGEDLEPMLDQQPVDLLLLDVNVPAAVDSSNPYPILHAIPQLLETYPGLTILVISMYAERPLIKAVMDAGASGYILKDDRAAIEELGSVIRSVAHGGVYLSQQATEQLLRRQKKETLTARQGEVISLFTAYPELTMTAAARELEVTESTVRNLLSGAYMRLGVHNRSAAIAKARELGLVTPPIPGAGA